jgi:hypothetical protein
MNRLYKNALMLLLVFVNFLNVWIYTASHKNTLVGTSLQNFDVKLKIKTVQVKNLCSIKYHSDKLDIHEFQF